MKIPTLVLSNIISLFMIALLSGPAFAAPGDSTSSRPRTLEERLEAIEARLRQLENRLNLAQPESSAKGDAGAAVSTPTEPLAARFEALDQKVRIIEQKRELEQAEAAAKKKETPIVISDGSGFSLRSADANYNLKIRAHVHADGRFFLDDKADNSASTFAIRRARLLFEGTLGKYFDFKFMPDFAGGRLVLQDAYLDARFLPQIRLRVGKMKTPFGLERLQQPVNISFVERALPNNLVPNRDLGIQLHGDLFGGTLNYMAGVFNGVPDGASGDTDNQDSKDYAARLFVQPFLKTEIPALRGFGIGMAATSGIHRGTLAAPSLPAYVTTGQSTFFGYRSDGTGAGTAIADGRLSRLSPQTYYQWGPFSLLGEHVISSQAVRKGGVWARLEQNATQLALTYVLTGEDASYRGVVPKKSLDPRAHTWGAFELTSRYSELSVDKNAFPLFADPSSAAKRAQAWAGGLNWYFNRNVKFVINYEQTFFKDGAPAGNRQTEKAIMTRFQLSY